MTDLLTTLMTQAFFFFFNDTATAEIYTLSLHDALPILSVTPATGMAPLSVMADASGSAQPVSSYRRSEEHTSELQSHVNLVCRLLLEKKKTGQSGSNAASARPRRPAVSLSASATLSRVV